MKDHQGWAIQIDEAALLQAIDVYKHIELKATDVVRIALNKTAPRIRTQASRAIRTQVRLPTRYVNERLTIVRATRANLNAKLLTPARGRLLSLFDTDAQVANDTIRWLSPPPVPRAGIKVKVKPSGSAKTVSGHPEIKGKPFYLVLQGSRRLAIAGRRRRAGKNGGQLQVLYGPSLSQVFNDVRHDVIPQAEDELNKQILDAIRYLVRKQMPPEDSPE